MRRIALALVVGACARPESATLAPASSASGVAPPAPLATILPVTSAAPSAAPAGGSATPDATATCPERMVAVPGGIFTMGSDVGNPEEIPKHRVALRTFCVDRTEITVKAYGECVARGACVAAHPDRGFCNAALKDRDDHPINCIDWNQASAACQFAGARLPTEREWEYAARGGSEQRTYSWGNDDPQGKSCYNVGSTCPVGKYPPGAFGLLDVGGNVWEWTSSAFAPYPDEVSEGATRVYRGGSFSRRFPKWMKNGLRNRYRPDEWGAHLGARCVQDLPGATCPAGSVDDGGACRPEGEPPRKPKTPSAPDRERPATSGGAAGQGPAPAASEEKKDPALTPVTMTRDTTFDADCAKFKPKTPVCYRVSGGSFADRQKAKGACSNRDVGAGWNSVCCPQ